VGVGEGGTNPESIREKRTIGKDGETPVRDNGLTKHEMTNAEGKVIRRKGKKKGKNSRREFAISQRRILGPLRQRPKGA